MSPDHQRRARILEALLDVRERDVERRDAAWRKQCHELRRILFAGKASGGIEASVDTVIAFLADEAEEAGTA